jgi:hypothetical protein
LTKKITSFFSNVQTSGIFNGFPKPCRLGRHRQTRTNAKPPMSSYYVQTLRKRFGTSSKSGSIAPAQKPKRPAWSRPPIDIEYSLTGANFPAPPTNKTVETKSTASSTKFTVSKDYKSIIEKEMALYKSEAA